MKTKRLLLRRRKSVVRDKVMKQLMINSN